MDNLDVAVANRVTMERGRVEALGEQIAEQAAHLDAATHRLLTDLRSFDDEHGWYSQGARSCAAWLSWRLGWSGNRAREHVRVAQRLGSLPAIDDALRKGELSYCKVRAMTRVATPANEQLLLDDARFSTGHQLELICQKYAMVQRANEPRSPSDDADRRRMTRYDLDDGMVGIRVVVHPDEAIVITEALAKVMREHSPTAVAGRIAAAEGSSHLANRADGARPPAERFGMVDALVEVCEAVVRGDRPERAATELVITVPAAALATTPAAALATTPAAALATTPAAALATTPAAALATTPAAALATTPTAALATTPAAALATTPAAALATTPTAALATTPTAALATTPAAALATTPAAALATTPAAALPTTPAAALATTPAAALATTPAAALATTPAAALPTTPAAALATMPARVPAETVVTVPLAETDSSSVGFGIASDGTCVSAETSRRLACDAGLVVVHHDSAGNPLSVGRKTRTIHAALKRALLDRDRTCRFPGCTNRRFLDGHHIKHWADGGETCLENTLALCRSHHRFVHEYGVRVELDTAQHPRFFDGRGRLIPDVPSPPDLVDAGAATIRRVNEPLAITAATNIPGWDGQPVNYSWVIDDLVRADRLT